MTETIQVHPEWKFLMERIRPLLAVDRLFTYEELQALLGMDARRGRGYQQLRRFQEEILKEDNIAFVCVTGRGYRVVKADEHNTLAMRRMDRSRRHLTIGLKLVTYVDRAQLTTAGAAHNADLQARLARNILFSKNEIQESRAVFRAARVDVPRPAIPEPKSEPKS